jgi:hypothetical protein
MIKIIEYSGWILTCGEQSKSNRYRRQEQSDAALIRQPPVGPLPAEILPSPSSFLAA